MGEVYRARDARLGRDVAIKVVAADRAVDGSAMARFEQEARAAAALSHPHIVAVFDVGWHDGLPFIVSELLEGETLRARLDAGPVPVRKALEWASQIAEGLAAAHARGVVHRDLKPENLFLATDGRMKILDFGLSKLIETKALAAVSGAATLPQTAHGVVMGTVGYMSPEQVAGSGVDARSDIFSLGVVLHELLTRQRTFRRATGAETMTAILHDDAAAPSTINPGVGAAVDLIVRRCLEKQPAARFQSASDLAFALSSASTASGSQSFARPSTAPIAGKKVAALAAGAVACVALGAASARYLANPSSANAARSSKHFVVVPRPALSESPTPFALSPEGTKLAYVGGANEGSQLYVRALNQLDAVLVPGTLAAADPFFSPDGRWVGFRRGGTLQKVPYAGGPVVTIAPLPDRGTLTAHWADDGAIYYSWGGSLWRVAAEGGSPLRLTTPDPAKGESIHIRPQLLPGGSHLLFTVVMATTDEASRVVVMPVGGGPLRTIVEGAASGRYLDSGHLTYLQGSTLFAVAFDAARLALRGAPAAVLDNVGRTSAGAHFAAAADGTMMFMQRTSTDRRSLVWVDRRGIASPIGTIAPRQFASPVVSPDGNRIAAVVSERSQSDLWLYERATGASGRLTFDGGIAAGLAWTPDGRYVTYAKNAKGASFIALQAVDGDRRSRQLFAATEMLWPGGWSADGQHLGYMRSTRETFGDVEVFDVGGSNTRRAVVATPATEWGAKLSPDGHWMAYTSNTTGTWEVYVQPFPGPGNPRTVSVDGGTEVVWSKDGREIFFRSGTRMMAAPTVMARDGLSIGAPAVLFDGPFVAGQPGLPNFDVSSDGQRFLMVQPGPDEATARPLHIIVDWFDDLRRLTAVAR